MKHVPRLAAEPEALASYRAENPADETAEGSAAAAVWDRFRDHAAYNEVRDQLVLRQQGLCGYCEQRLTYEEGGALIRYDQQIEHVLSKSAGTGRTVDWTNFMLCCGGGSYKEKEPRYLVPARHYAGDRNVSCGQSKGDKSLGAGCDPRDFPCELRLVSVGLDGTMKPNEVACRAAGVDPELLGAAINDVLNLNCERLRVARGKIVDEILKWHVPLLEEQLRGSHLTGEGAAELCRLIVEGRLRPDRHGHLRAFWTTERQYLEPWSSEWIRDNRGLLGGSPESTLPEGSRQR